jgi:hypothetical protein
MSLPNPFYESLKKIILHSTGICCNQTAFKQNLEKLSVSKFLSFIAGVANTGDYSNFYIWMYSWLFLKIRNGFHGVFTAIGETDSWKKPEAENLVSDFI